MRIVAPYGRAGWGDEYTHSAQYFTSYMRSAYSIGSVDPDEAEIVWSFHACI